MKKTWIAIAVLLVLTLTFVPASRTTASTATSTEVLVSFEGIVVHVLGGGVTRAIVPRLAGHQMTITLPPSTKADVERIFSPLKCPTVCDVPIDGLAFRVVGADGRPAPKPFTASPEFTSVVTRLSEIPAPEKPFATKEDLVPEIFAEGPVAHNIIAGYFELNGGTATTDAFACGAKFDGQKEFKAFPLKVDVVYTMNDGAVLQVLKAGSSKWEEIPLNGPLTKIAVRNDLPDSNMSHFDMLAMLSTKRDAQGGFVDLPEIKTDGTRCISPAGGLPGCTNSAWP
jgi:hypothetical protein